MDAIDENSPATSIMVYSVERFAAILPIDTEG
jgi:hypothetical protein